MKPEPSKTTRHRHPLIAREGWGYTGGLLVLSVISVTFGGWLWAFAFLLFACAVAGFFRDPERTSPEIHGAVVSPADGRVVAVEPVPEGGQAIRIFLSPLDVHINRSPITGRLADIQYQKGRFLAAFKAAASEENEQNALDIQSDTGDNFRVVQIAGVVARRIICWSQKGDTLERGERFGLIQFGSRTDLYMPAGYQARVKIGDRVRGGETIVGQQLPR